MQFDTTLSQFRVQPQNGVLEEDGSGLPFIKSSAWKVNETRIFGWFPWKISRAAERLKTLVVYQLQGQTGPRFRQMVYANFKQTCTNKFHLPKNNLEGLKLVSKMDLKKWDSNVRLEYSVRKNKPTFSDAPLLSEIFRWKDPKSCVPFNFQSADFPETFCKR